MFNRKSLSIFLFSFTFLLSGCKNEEDIITPTQQKLLSKIVQDENNYSVFYYDGNKLSRYESFSNSQLFYSITLNYENKNKPQSENYFSNNDDIIKYYYYNSNSQLDSMTFSIKDNSGIYTKVGCVKYYYNNIGQLAKTEQYTNSNIFVVKFEYAYDSNGNIIEEKQFSPNGLFSVATWTYDDKVNPWYSYKDSFFYNTSKNKNNVLSLTQVFTNTTQEDFQNTISYTYDSDGYPLSSVTQVSSQSNNLTINNTFEYK